jgi:hypothetical protein
LATEALTAYSGNIIDPLEESVAAASLQLSDEEYLELATVRESASFRT